MLRFQLSLIETYTKITTPLFQYQGQETANTFMHHYLRAIAFDIPIDKKYT